MKGNYKTGADGLTPRQREVLMLIVNGYSRANIVAELGVSRHTVDSHRINIMERLKLFSTADLVKYAMNHGLIR